MTDFILLIQHIIQCIRKVFTALHFFHILLCYSIFPKWNKFFFFPQNSTTTPHNDNMKSFFEMLAHLLKIKKAKKSHVHKYSQPLLNTAERLTVDPVWGQERSGAGPGCLCTLLHSSFPLSWLVSQFLLLKNIPTAWCCYHHASL